MTSVITDIITESDIEFMRRVGMCASRHVNPIRIPFGTSRQPRLELYYHATLGATIGHSSPTDLSKVEFA